MTQIFSNNYISLGMKSYFFSVNTLTIYAHTFSTPFKPFLIHDYCYPPCYQGEIGTATLTDLLLRRRQSPFQRVTHFR